MDCLVNLGPFSCGTSITVNKSLFTFNLNLKIFGATFKVDTKIDFESKTGTFLMIYDSSQDSIIAEFIKSIISSESFQGQASSEEKIKKSSAKLDLLDILVSKKKTGQEL